MNKIGFTLFLIIILSFMACSTQNEVGTNGLNGGIGIDILSENIGKTKEVVFKSLNLKEGKNVELSDKMAGAYILKDEQKFYGEDFLLALNFDANNDKMYGFMYIKDFEDNLKDGYNLTKKLYQDLTKEYGDPTTYPESPNSISKIPSYEELATDRISHYMETWKVNDEISVTLEMKYIPDTGIRIAVQYAVLVPTTRTRG
ncbi:hypothetical protein [Caldicoprobacter faecalis]|uniref:Lipoprotein n=1 Tax=Caldicoprobacter faecalis TaxID=937334 RepID=A0A1I5UK21_9FIRM|nr:hypothetical protein [Caldicoprobacter faecalis]SFP95387.1 hypothetical protein SAMN05444406_10762 [Caldicoprobacter faecalis]